MGFGFHVGFFGRSTSVFDQFPCESAGVPDTFYLALMLQVSNVGTKDSLLKGTFVCVCVFSNIWLANSRVLPDISGGFRLIASTVPHPIRNSLSSRQPPFSWFIRVIPFLIPGAHRTSKDPTMSCDHLTRSNPASRGLCAVLGFSNHMCRLHGCYYPPKNKPRTWTGAPARIKGHWLFPLLTNLVNGMPPDSWAWSNQISDLGFLQFFLGDPLQPEEVGSCCRSVGPLLGHLLVEFLKFLQHRCICLGALMFSP